MTNSARNWSVNLTNWCDCSCCSEACVLFTWSSRGFRYTTILIKHCWSNTGRLHTRKFLTSYESLIPIKCFALSDHEVDTTYYPHPHHPFGFTDIPLASRNHPIWGLCCYAIMMYNFPHMLRIWRHYITRKAEKPSVGLYNQIFLNKSLAFLLNRAKCLPAQFYPSFCGNEPKPIGDVQDNSVKEPLKFVIKRVVIAHKIIELVLDLEWWEEILLETAHIKSATKALMAVKVAMDREHTKESLTKYPKSDENCKK